MTKLPEKMRAVVINDYGKQDQLQYLDNVAIPPLGDKEVLVKVHATSVNPVDWKVREGYLSGVLNHSLPLILGWDVAGEIVAKGAGVTGWQLGDAIYSRPNIERNGAYAEYIAITVDEIALKPESLNWEQAAAVPLTALTAWQALYDAASLKAGDKVLIHAGAGGVGHFAIQLAKLKGAEVYTTCSAANTALVKTLGVDTVIDYQKEDFSTLRGFDVVFDTLGGDVLAKSWQVLKPGGQLVSIIDSPDEDLAKQYNVEAHFVFVQPNVDQLQQLAQLIDNQQLKVLIDSTFTLADVAKAHAKSETGRAKGKIVLSVA